MKFMRFYTQAGLDVFLGAQFRTVSSEQWQEYIVPQHWNQSAVDILLERVFYPHSLPAMTRKVEEADVPSWLWRREPDHAGLDSISGEWRHHREKDIREVLHRIAGALTYRAWKNKLFTAEQDAEIFYDELRYIFFHQIASPEMNIWMSLGLDWAYGLNNIEQFAPRHHVAAFNVDQPHAVKRADILSRKLSLTGDKARITLPIEHEESLALLSWKRDVDIKNVSENLGRRVLQNSLYHVMDACDRDSFFGFDPLRNPQLLQATDDARQSGLPEAAIRMAISYAEQGYEEIKLPANEDEPSSAQTVKTTLSIPDDFIEAALTGHSFMQHDGPGQQQHYPAQEIFDLLSEAIWSTGEPAILFKNGVDATNITGKSLSADTTGGFIFTPDSRAPSGTINLLASTVESVPHITRLMTVALDSVSQDNGFRPLFLGITNLSAVLMGQGLAYDSEAGRVTAALMTALVSGSAYRTSAEMAAVLGAFPAWPDREKIALQTIKDKMSILSGASFLQKGMMRRPAQLRTALCPDLELVDAVKQTWEEVYKFSKDTGLRHAHLTGIDTDPAVQILLNAQTQDIMPESTLVRFEGYFASAPDAAALYGKKLNPMVPRALARLGYSTAERDDIHFYAVGHGTLLDAPYINHKTLREKGFPQAALDAVESALASALHIRFAFNKWTLGEDFCRRILSFTTREMETFTFDMLTSLGFTEDQIEAANVYCCGTMTLEGAPHLKPSHLAVFDCIAPTSPTGVRRVSAEAQIEMQAAVESFLSGAVSHTVMLSYHTSIEDIRRLILRAWERGVKTLTLYRDNCSLLHPMAPPTIPNQELDQQEEEEFLSCLKQSITA